MNRFVDELLLGIESRGKQATGFVSVTFDGKVKIDKHPITATEFIKERERIPGGVQTILLHTRFKTKGDTSNPGNNHPVIYKSCFAIHNGSINNDDELFKEHSLKRNYEVDSEIIPALLDKYGMTHPDAIKTALEEMRGPMAIASIDPVQNPGQLLLAKGSFSPLNIYHTENFIVWASEAKAIREAWGTVFGTPPEYKKIGFLPEGKFWIANGEDVKEYQFEVPFGWSRRATTTTGKRNSSTSRRQTTKNGSTNGSNGQRKRSYPWERATSIFATERHFQEKVKEYRKNNENVCRIWSKREEYDDDVFKDIKGRVSWLPCICGESVAAEDMTQHILYGMLCRDCYEVIIKGYRQGNNEPETKDEFDWENALTSGDKRGLEYWGQVDATLHYWVIAELVDETDYSYEAIDYLLRTPDRTGSGAGDYGVKIKKLRNALQKRYDEIEADIWQNHAEELMQDVGNFSDEKEQDQYVAFSKTGGNGTKEVWFQCLKHKVEFQTSGTCKECEKEGGPSTTPRRFRCYACDLTYPRYQVTSDSNGEYICDNCKFGATEREDKCGVEPFAAEHNVCGGALDTIQRCEVCNAFKPGDAACRVCEANGLTAPAPEAETCICLTRKGNPCKRKPKFYIGNKGYCFNHYRFCDERGCDERANHVLVNGRRVCHQHARCQEGAKADKALARDGVVFTEVR